MCVRAGTSGAEYTAKLRSHDKAGSPSGSKGGWRPQLGTYFVPGYKTKGVELI